MNGVHECNVSGDIRRGTRAKSQQAICDQGGQLLGSVDIQKVYLLGHVRRVVALHEGYLVT